MTYIKPIHFGHFRLVIPIPPPPPAPFLFKRKKLKQCCFELILIISLMMSKYDYMSVKCVLVCVYINICI